MESSVKTAEGKEWTLCVTGGVGWGGGVGGEGGL